MADHLALVACGSPLAARVHEIAALAVDAGWVVHVVATPAALGWLDTSAAEAVTGHPVLTEQRMPGQTKRFPPPTQVVVCPATFNTVNKLAVGIMDTYPAGLLCEALATGTPMTIAPMISTRLWSHPAWQPHLELLTAAGVRFLDIRTGHTGRPEPVPSGSANDVIAAFDPAWVLAATGSPANGT